MDEIFGWFNVSEGLTPDFFVKFIVFIIVIGCFARFFGELIKFKDL